MLQSPVILVTPSSRVWGFRKTSQSYASGKGGMNKEEEGVF